MRSLTPAGASRAAAVLVLGLAATASHAGLFDDDEARRAIVDLRAKVEQLQQQNQKETQARQAEIAEAITVLKRSLLELNTQIETVRADVARLRGADELRARDLSDLQRKPQGAPTDAGPAVAALEERIKQLEEKIKRMEPLKVSVDGQQFLVSPEEKKAYEDAIAPIRTGDFAAAADALATFQRRYPASGYNDSVLYWLGNAQYGKRDYKDAIGSFRALISASPQHPRASEALLAIANCQAELKETKSARRTLDELLKTYPQSEAAAAGRQRLATLK